MTQLLASFGLAGIAGFATTALVYAVKYGRARARCVELEAMADEMDDDKAALGKEVAMAGRHIARLRGEVRRAQSEFEELAVNCSVSGADVLRRRLDRMLSPQAEDSESGEGVVLGGADRADHGSDH